MRNVSKIGLALAAGAVLGVLASGALRTEAAPVGEPRIGHMVYFSLKDNSAAKADELVAACNKYLSKHPGEVFYASGTLAKELKREVNDQDWDVALHIVFNTKADHDHYQDAPRHKQFIDENRANWKNVRVFDSLIQPTGPATATATEK